MWGYPGYPVDGACGCRPACGGFGYGSGFALIIVLFILLIIIGATFVY